MRGRYGDYRRTRVRTGDRPSAPPWLVVSALAGLLGRNLGGIVVLVIPPADQDLFRKAAPLRGVDLLFHKTLRPVTDARLSGAGEQGGNHNAKLRRILSMIRNRASEPKFNEIDGVCMVMAFGSGKRERLQKG